MSGRQPRQRFCGVRTLAGKTEARLRRNLTAKDGCSSSRQDKKQPAELVVQSWGPSMSAIPSPPGVLMSDAQAKGHLYLLLANLCDRVSKIEEAGQKSALKKITENAGAVALFLGLVLTAASLYEVFVTRPRADRIE